VCFAATATSAFLLGVLVEPGIRELNTFGAAIVLGMLSLIAISVGLAVDKRWAAVGGMALAPGFVAVGVFLVVESVSSVLLWTWWFPTMGLAVLSIWEVVAADRARATAASAGA